MSITRLAQTALAVSLIVVLVYITARNDSYQFKHALFALTMTYMLLFFSNANPKFGQALLNNSIFLVFVCVSLNVTAWALYPTVDANKLTHNIQMATCTIMSYQLAFYLIKTFLPRLSGSVETIDNRQFMRITAAASVLSLLFTALLFSLTGKPV